jgi:hypothetical protein
MNDETAARPDWRGVTLGWLALAGWLWVAALVFWPVRPIDVYDDMRQESASCGSPALVSSPVSGGIATDACESAADHRLRLAGGVGVLAGPLAAGWLALRTPTRRKRPGDVPPPAEQVPAAAPVEEHPREAEFRAFESSGGRW